MANEGLTDEIVANAQGPSSASGDSGSVTQHSLPDQILGDKYLRAKDEAASTGLGLVFKRIEPPGAQPQ